MRCLSSEHVQEAIAQFVGSAVTTSLEVERRHAQVKRANEARTVARISATSRNCILRRLQARSAATGAAIKAAPAEKRKASFTRPTSLAWRNSPRAVPEGRSFGEHSRCASDLDALRSHVDANRER